MLLPTLVLSACKPTAPKRNVLLITIDTLRADRLGCYNSRFVETPNIDKIAAQGVLFEKTITPVPLTLPSHTSILTGRYPAEHGIRDNGFYRLPKGYPTLATELKKAGFSTAAFVSSHTLNDIYGLNQSFDVYDDLSLADKTRSFMSDRSERPANETTTKVIEWLKKNPKQPFFLWVHYFDPHVPYDPPSPYREQYPKMPYEGEVAFTDHEVGRLMESVKEQNLDSNTLIILTADHGESLGEHGESTHGIFLYRSTMMVPLIFKGPGVPAAKKIKTMVRLIDICPTILSYTNANKSFKSSGRDLLQIITGRAIPSSEPIYIETEGPLNLMGWSPLKGLRTERFKFIAAPANELYDVESNPAENQNLITSQPDTANDMRKKVLKMEAIFSKSSNPAAAEFFPEAEARERLESLGYVGEKAARRPTYKNPADMLGVLKLYYKAEGYNRKGDCAMTIETVTDALALDPENTRMLELLAHCYHVEKKYDKSAAAYEKLLKLAPRVIAAWADLASVYTNLERYDDAITSAKKALQLDPKLTHSYIILGMVADRQGRKEDAIKNYRKALEIDRDNQLALSKLGAILSADPATRDEGIELTDKARVIIEKNKKNP